MTRLWRAVFAQALKDLFFDDTPAGLRWLVSKDGHMVASLANLDYDRLLMKVKDLLTEPDAKKLKLIYHLDWFET